MEREIRLAFTFVLVAGRKKSENSSRRSSRRQLFIIRPEKFDATIYNFDEREKFGGEGPPREERVPGY